MMRKFASLIVMFSIVIAIVAPSAQSDGPDQGLTTSNPDIMRTADHGFGS